MIRLLAATLIFLMMACAHQTSETIQDKKIYRILLQEQLVGRLTLETSFQPNQVITKESLELKTAFRGMKAITSRILETHVETPEGKVLSYLRQHQTPNAEREYFGEMKNGYWHWQKKQGGHFEHLRVKAPEDFLLHHGLTNKMK